MASNPQAPTQSLPPLYKSLMPLSSTAHADFGLRPRTDLKFAQGFHAIPITVDEFAMAQRNYPIVFSSGEANAPLALVGLSEGQNAYLSAEGEWRSGYYVPAYIRRYPFLLARLRADTQELTLCFDDTYSDIGAGTGDALFDGTEASEVTKNVLNFCEQYEQSMARTKAFVDELIKSELLMDGEVTIQQDGMAKPAVYRGFRMVSEDKVKDLRGDQARKLIQNGALPLIYAHMFSLSLIRDVFAEVNRAQPA